MGPYREATATEAVEAATRDGLVKLEVAPRHLVLKVGTHVDVSVTDHFMTVVRIGRNGRRKRRSIRLDDTRLLVARAIPAGDAGVWHEVRPGVVTRLLGLRAVELLEDDALDAWRALERLTRRLHSALAAHAGGVQRSFEVGSGADRVLIMDHGDRLVFYVRRLFRERPRRALEVRADGTIVFPGKNRTRRIQCRSRFGVTSTGDYIRFADRTGRDLGSLSIPWVTPEDRAEIVKLIGERIDHDAQNEQRR